MELFGAARCLEAFAGSVGCLGKRGTSARSFELFHHISIISSPLSPSALATQLRQDTDALWLDLAISATCQYTMDASCACGAVRFTTPTPAPLKLYHCHCIDCRKQSASAFGTSAVFPFFRLPNNPSIAHFDHQCDSGRKKRCYFCKGCGSRIMHERILEKETPKVVSIKGGLIEGLNWTGGTHIFCRSAVVPIPEGAEQFEAEPTN